MPPVSTYRGRDAQSSERATHRVLFRAGSKDRIGLGDNREPSLLSQRISVIIQRFNSVLLQNSFSSGNE